MGVIHVRQGLLEFASLAEVFRILEVGAGHSEEVLRHLPEVGARRRRQLALRECPLREADIFGDQRAEIPARPSGAAIKPFPLRCLRACVGQSSMTLTLSPPCRVSRGRTSTMSGIWSPPPVMIATPIGRREISSAIAVVSPSTLAMIAFRSFGFVTFRMICVLHWLRTFLSTFAARCVMTTSPRPNLRPSEARVRNTFDDAAWPT